MVSRRFVWLVQSAGIYWRIVSRWLKANSVAPAWMPPRWRHPLIGYLLASVLIMLTITLEYAVFHVWLPMEQAAGIFVFLLIVFVGLTWGAGPSLLTTVLGTFLLIYVVYPPAFGITVKYVVDVVSDGIVLFGGLCVTMIASHRERERRAAERRTYEAERERRRVQGELETLLAMVEALVQPASATEDMGPPVAAVDGQAAVPAQDLVAQRLAGVLAYTLEVQRVCLYALDAETGELALQGAADRSPDKAQRWGEATAGQPLPSSVWLDDGVLRRLHAGEVVQIEEEPQPPSEHGGARSWSGTRVASPLQRDATLLGVVTFEVPRTAARSLSENLELAPAITQMGALVIERERLVNEREIARAEGLAQQKARRQLEGFLGIASHELKTPLMVLLLGLQVTQQRLDRLVAHPTTTATAGADADVGNTSLASVQQHLRRVYRHSKRLDRLVNELLESSQIESGHLDLRRERTDLAALVGAAIEEVRALVPERTIDLRPLPAQPVLVDADGERLGHVLTNYLSNALKYSAEDRPVTVEVRLEGEAARVAVTDEGPGLPPSEQERIWQRFYRVQGIEVRSGSGVGLGLGLYISKTIVERHDGQVGVESAEGQGSTFWFTLPLVTGGAGDNTRASPTS